LNPGVNDGQWNDKDKTDNTVPGLSSETYSGWLTHWSEGFAGKST